MQWSVQLKTVTSAYFMLCVFHHERERESERERVRARVREQTCVRTLRTFCVSYLALTLGPRCLSEAAGLPSLPLLLLQGPEAREM